jgi:hypothetical protein
MNSDIIYFYFWIIIERDFSQLKAWQAKYYIFKLLNCKAFRFKYNSIDWIDEFD